MEKIELKKNSRNSTSQSTEPHTLSDGWIINLLCIMGKTEARFGGKKGKRIILKGFGGET